VRASPISRIVSLVPSATETLRAWGRDPIACTRFCERADLPHVGGTKDPDVARIVELEPDLVIVDTEENRRDDFDELVRLGLQVHVLCVRSLDDVAVQLAMLAARLDAAWSPQQLGEPCQLRRRAFVPIWRRPWMALGDPTYGASLLAHLGVAAVPQDLGPYPEVTLEDVAALHPDVVLAPSEPYPFTTRQLPELESVAPTVFVDGKDLFWWGVRTPGALARLGDQLRSI
jgi:ABC-type Fe3+-hydroxamate transport system substrate-binding protein